MSITLIQTTDKEFMHYVSKAYADGYLKALKETENSTKKTTLKTDTISETKALELLKCGKSKLSKLRQERAIVFYTISRPYSYSKKSIESYITSQTCQTSHPKQ